MPRRQGRREVAGAKGPKHLGQPRKVIVVSTSDLRLDSLTPGIPPEFSSLPAVPNAFSTPGETPSSLHASLSCRFLRTHSGTQPAIDTPIPSFQHRFCGACFTSIHFSRETQSFLLQTEMTLSPPAQDQVLCLLGQKCLQKEALDRFFTGT